MNLDEALLSEHPLTRIAAMLAKANIPWHRSTHSQERAERALASRRIQEDAGQILGLLAEYLDDHGCHRAARHLYGLRAEGLQL